MSQLPIRLPLFQGHSRSFWTPTLGCKEENVAKVLRIIVTLFCLHARIEANVLFSFQLSVHKSIKSKSNVSSVNDKKNVF